MSDTEQNAQTERPRTAEMSKSPRHGQITCKECGESDYSAIVRSVVAVHAHEYRAAGERHRHIEGSESPDLDFGNILALRCRTKDCPNSQPGIENVLQKNWTVEEPAAWAPDAVAWRRETVKAANDAAEAAQGPDTEA